MLQILVLFRGRIAQINCKFCAPLRVVKGNSEARCINKICTRSKYTINTSTYNNEVFIEQLCALDTLVLYVL